MSENEFQEISDCVTDIQDYNSIIASSQARLNVLIDITEQHSVEFIIRDQANVKAKNGILQELCDNYFEIDDETFGCRVAKPQVQIFYQTQSAATEITFVHWRYVAQYAPYSSVANFEFIPYGQTQYNSETNSYHCPQGDNQCYANWAHVSRKGLSFYF